MLEKELKERNGKSKKDLAFLLHRLNLETIPLTDGYAPFCKHLFAPNFTQARSAVAKITDENAHFLRSGYRAWTDEELPVLVRWFEGVIAPRAEYLDVILYSREQCEKEETDIGDADWGIVAILGVLDKAEQPMPPITMMRNSLGIAEGGSGVPIDRQAYQRSVEF